jgi:hypothetical protein
MPLFACEFIENNKKCNTIENTALVADAWTRKINKQPMLCSLHSNGKWHNKFKQEKFDPAKWKEEDGFLNEI